MLVMCLEVDLGVVMHVPSSESDNQIHHHEEDALKPVRFAISNEVIDLQEKPLVFGQGWSAE